MPNSYGLDSIGLFVIGVLRLRSGTGLCTDSDLAIHSGFKANLNRIQFPVLAVRHLIGYIGQRLPPNSTSLRLRLCSCGSYSSGIGYYVNG
jgi:hypothetical protein